VSAFAASKVVNNLPGILSASTVYFVRSGAGFDIFVTNENGQIVAYPLNQGGGDSTLSGQALVTLPNGVGVFEHTETVEAAGITPADTIIVMFASGDDADENESWMLDPSINPVGTAGANEITFELAFREKTSGPIKLVWKAL
jgi:hypothetical protein